MDTVYLIIPAYLKYACYRNLLSKDWEIFYPNFKLRQYLIPKYGWILMGRV